MKKNYYSNTRWDVLNLLPKQRFNNALEIGGGEFPTLLELSKKSTPDYVEIWGVDIFRPGSEEIKFILGSIEDESVCARIPDNYFEVVIANDVIEHLVDSNKFLATIHRKLVPGGILALSVPNIRQVRSVYKIFFQGTFPRESAGLFDATHLRWFCKADIMKLANPLFLLKDWRCAGRFVPSFLSKTLYGELIGLHNLFVFQKR
jgi:SAM-dependent methyltransferase